MKSVSSQRGTTKKKVASTSIDDDGEVGNHLSADSNSDENYDDIMIDHFETTFEKSIAPQKRARMFGGSSRKQRGTFGTGMKNKASFFNSNKVTTPNVRKNESANKATAALLQQQQEENFDSSHLYSIGLGAAIGNNDDDDDDETNLYDMLKCIPSDLRPGQTTKKPASHHHQRSESAVPAIPSRSPFRLVRSSTNVPQRPNFYRRLQRSHSMALNRNVDDKNLDFWDDNTTNPENGRLDAIEQTIIHGPPKTRKLVRAQRRHSWIPHSDMIRSTSTTTSTTTTSSGSLTSASLLHGSTASFPEGIDDLDVVAGNSSNSKLFASLSQTNINDMSPEPRSETSTSTGCRKRGVSTSSVSDLEEYIQMSGGSLSSKRRNHSSEQLLRVFSMTPGQQMPLAPCLDYIEDYNGSDFTTSFGRHRHNASVADKRKPKEAMNDKNARFDRLENIENMDQDTSIEDAQSEKMSSPDSSFEAIDDYDDAILNKMPSANVVVEESFDSKLERVLETMPSIDDLTFLINELKDEERRSHRLIVGAGDMWKIAPPLQQWTSYRRTTFIHWAKVSLGFIVRSAGMGYMFVQIHKKSGLQLVELLEHAKTKYMASNPPNPIATQQNSSQLIFTNHIQNRMEPAEDQSNSACGHSVHLFQTRTMADTDELVGKLATLTMTSKSNDFTIALGNSPNHKVTVPMTFEDNIPIESGNSEKCERLSIDQLGVMSKSSRPSFDSHTHSGDLSQHLLGGHSPRMNLGRPPKGTITSYRCSIDGADNGGSTRNGRTPNAENLCFVTTPLMVKDRGWGSRPIEGQDWGTSVSCENTTLNELIIRFERSLAMNGLMSTSGEHQFPAVSLSQLDFDLEADNGKTRFSEDNSDSANILILKNADRLHRKRVSNYNKMKRMSLFATAVTSHLNLPVRQSKCIEVIEEVDEKTDPAELCSQSGEVVTAILSFLNESELMTKAFPVCRAWSDYATVAHTKLLVTSIQDDEIENIPNSGTSRKQAPILEMTWKGLHRRFPWACFLAEGGAKKVHKVYNSDVKAEEALSVMDTHTIDNVQIVANELAVSAMVSSLVRRGVCPNFVAMHRVFTCAYAPPESCWGNDANKFPKGVRYDTTRTIYTPKEPKGFAPGRYQYIQMELVNEGDAEELIKRQHSELLPTDVARIILFQVSYALFAAAEKFSIKHYDVKLLNVFIQNTHSVGDLILRYGLGSHIFALKMPSNAAFIAKLADFGTSNMAPSTNGLPVTISHFTTLENTPPDYLILGDNARQGHSHDNFGLGLVMLHLFTGFRPYEEILEDVSCPPNLKERLQKIWENERISGYSVIRSVIFDGVDVDEYGNVEGDPDNTLYDTLYRYLVLFGIPKQRFQEKSGRLVWNAITDALQGTTSTAKKIAGSKQSSRKKANTDITTFKRDSKKYSIRSGTNIYIARARRALTAMDGGLDLLFRLCNFDPTTRATAMDVLNSTFMDCLREQPGWMRHHYDDSTDVRSFLNFSTTNG